MVAPKNIPFLFDAESEQRVIGHICAPSGAELPSLKNMSAYRTPVDDPAQI